MAYGQLDNYFLLHLYANCIQYSFTKETLSGSYSYFSIFHYSIIAYSIIPFFHIPLFHFISFFHFFHYFSSVIYIYIYIYCGYFVIIIIIIIIIAYGTVLLIIRNYHITVATLN